MTDQRMQLRTIAARLGAFTYRYGSEVQLHQGLSGVLDDAGYVHQREYSLNRDNRADFWLPLEEGGLVIEVKVDGTFGEALRQVDRYINLPEVKGVLLASTVRWATQPLRQRPKWQGKDFAMAYLRRQAL